MKRLSKVNKVDWGLVPVTPDPDFDPKHNEWVIEETIRINDLKRAKIQREFKAETQERVEDLTMFLKGIDQGGRSSDLDQYFGKKHAAYLRGEQIVSKLREQYAQKIAKRS